MFPRYLSYSGCSLMPTLSHSMGSDKRPFAISGITRTFLESKSPVFLARDQLGFVLCHYMTEAYLLLSLKGIHQL